MLFEQNIASNVTRNQEPKHINIKKLIKPTHIHKLRCIHVHSLTHVHISAPTHLYPHSHKHQAHLHTRIH